MGHSKHMQVQRSSPWDRARSGFGEASKKSNRGWSNELCWRLLSGSWHDCQVRTDNQQEIQTGAIDRQFNRDFQDEAKKKGHPWTLAKVRYSDWRERHGFNIFRCLTPACRWVLSSHWMPCQTPTMWHCGARWKQDNANYVDKLIIAGERWAQARGQHQGYDLHTAKTYFLHICILYPE